MDCGLENLDLKRRRRDNSPTEKKYKKNDFLKFLSISERMTRIDPKQLLSTLSVLLAPDGGIRSVEEVNITQFLKRIFAS